MTVADTHRNSSPKLFISAILITIVGLLWIYGSIQNFIFGVASTLTVDGENGSGIEKLLTGGLVSITSAFVITMVGYGLVCRTYPSKRMARRSAATILTVLGWLLVIPGLLISIAGLVFVSMAEGGASTTELLGVVAIPLLDAPFLLLGIAAIRSAKYFKTTAPDPASPAPATTNVELG